MFYEKYSCLLCSHAPYSRRMKNTPTSEPSVYPLRYCTGGCCNGAHSAHVYRIDPVDGLLSEDKLCPGNQSQVREFLDEDDGTPTGYGFIAQVSTI